MTRLVMEVSDGSLLAFGNSAEQTLQVVRMAAAAKLYELGRLSSGAAAELAGVPRAVFLGRLSEVDVCAFDFDEAQFAQERRLA